MTRIAVLISGRGSNAKAVADKCFSGDIAGEIVCFGSDNPDAKGLEYAKERKVPVFSVDYKGIINEYNADPDNFNTPDDFDFLEIEEKTSFIPVKDKRKYLMTRAKAENAILENILPHKPDILILAGFMRTFTPYFIDRFSPDLLNPKIMNIHPAILPSFPGVDGYGDTFFYGCKIGGCTVHFVDYGTDSGPVIVQKTFNIEPKDSLEDIKARGLKLEWEAYPEAVKLYVDDKLRIEEVKRVTRGKEDTRRIVKII